MIFSNTIDYNLKFSMLKIILQNLFNAKSIEYTVNPSPTLPLKMEGSEFQFWE